MADMARLGSGIPLVARQAELRALKDALDQARLGRPSAVLLSGDAGVGKSRLLTELVTSARDDGHAAFMGRCLDTAEATLPYLPFAEAIRQVAEYDPDLINRHAAISRLLPAEHPRPDAGGANQDLGQLQLFEAIHEALSELAADQTTVLAIEDLHWADRSSRDLLAFLLARLSTQRLLVVATFRSDDLHRRHPLRPLLTELVRLPAVERLHLEPFPLVDAEVFVRTLADQTLPDDVVHSIAERSEGNAFMAEELLSASPGDVPPELADVLLARVERLSSETQQVIRLASVIGRRFTHERLSTAADIPGDELDHALREAVAHNVVVTEDGGEAYSFRHALLHEAVYSDLLPGERSRLHAQVAKALAGDQTQGAAAELAHHTMQSHDLRGALAASVRAAKEAEELDAPAEMLVHTERALQLWPAVDHPDEIGGIDLLPLTLWAARAAARSGEPDRAIAHSRSAMGLVDKMGDPLAAAELRCTYVNYLFTLDGTEERAYSAAREALQLVVDREPSAVKARAQSTLARASMVVGRYDEAGDLAAAAIETARAVPGEGPQTAAEADALVTRTVTVDIKHDGLDQALERLGEAVALAAKVNAHDVELRARFNRGAVLLEEAGRLPDALAEFDAAVERAAATGRTWSGYGLELRVLQVIARFIAGAWDGSEAASELAGEATSSTVVTRVSAAGLLVAVGRGNVDLAERRLAHLRDRWRLDQQVMTLVGLCGAELELWRGRPERAVDYIEEALQRLHRTAPWHFVALSLCAIGTWASADLADATRRARNDVAEQQAVAAGETLAEYAANTMKTGRPRAAKVGPEGRAWMSRTEAEATRLRGKSDPAAWRAVIDAFGYGDVYRQAYAHWRLAEALLASGDRLGREEAAEHLRLAAQAADDLGAVPLRQAVGALARRARLRLDDSAAASQTATDLLTPRERSVLTLVATGRTNRQIGEELFISEKTVSVHLTRVMAKLGAASRAEAVSAAYTQGILAPSQAET
jgi:DNA-binding CsgD family transcriptional regulator